MFSPFFRIIRTRLGTTFWTNYWVVYLGRKRRREDKNFYKELISICYRDGIRKVYDLG